MSHVDDYERAQAEHKKRTKDSEQCVHRVVRGGLTEQEIAFIECVNCKQIVTDIWPRISRNYEYDIDSHCWIYNIGRVV